MQGVYSYRSIWEVLCSHSCSAVERLVALAIAESPKRAIPLGELQRLTALSRATIKRALKSLKTKFLDWVSTPGGVSIFRFSFGDRQRVRLIDSEVRQAGAAPKKREAQPEPRGVHSEPGGAHSEPGSRPGESLPQTGGGLKTLSFKDLKEELRVNQYPREADAPQNSPSFSNLDHEKTPAPLARSGVQNLVAYHRELCGTHEAETKRPLVIPEGDLCCLVRAALDQFALGGCMDAILAHMTAERQQKKQASGRINPFLGLEWIFKPVRLDGRVQHKTLDSHRFSELVAMGKAIRQRQEKDAAELAEKRARDAEPIVPRERTRAKIDECLLALGMGREYLQRQAVGA